MSAKFYCSISWQKTTTAKLLCNPEILIMVACWMIIIAFDVTSTVWWRS